MNIKIAIAVVAIQLLLLVFIPCGLFLYRGSKGRF
jgi:hypothetical protein